MVLEKNREKVREKVKPFANQLAKIFTPNQVTILSFIQALISSIFFLNDYLLIGTFFAITSTFLDVFDGIIARIKSIETNRGDFLDHTIDRLSDAAILVGLTFSSYVTLELGLIAVVGTLLTGYIGTQADAIGIKRIYGGLTSRSDIFFYISLGTILTALLKIKTLNMYPIDWIIAFLALTTNFTALQRIYMTWKKLN